MNLPKIQEEPTRFTPAQWIVRGLRLPLWEICRRIGSLAVGLPASAMKIARLRRFAARNGKRLHLVIMTERLGDIVAAEPAVRGLRQPGDLMVWLVRETFADAISFAHPIVEGVIAVSSYTEAIILRRLFPTIFFSNLHVDQALCGVFGFKYRSPNSFGITIDNHYDNKRTLCDVYSLIATGERAICTPHIWPDPTFDARSFVLNTFGTADRPLIVLHAMSNEAARSWNPDRARGLAKLLLNQTDANILEVGLTPVLDEAPRVRHLGNHLRLPQQFGVVGAASLFVGVDSSFAHIANAAGVPCAFILGAYHGFGGDYLPWQLRDGDVVIRTDEQVFEVEARRVMAAVETFIRPTFSTMTETGRQ